MTRLTNLILAVALIAAISYVLGRETSEAAGTDDDAPVVRVAVVDFTRLGRQVEDFDRIRRLLGGIRELGTARTDWFKRRLGEVEADLQALRDYDQQGTPEWEDMMAEHHRLLADFASVKAVTEFEEQKKGSVYSARLLDKVLGAIRHRAINDYDIVFKVLGDADTDEDTPVNEALRFNLNRAREVLYHDARVVTDLTDRVAADLNNDRALSDELETESKRTHEERQEWLLRGGTSRADRDGDSGDDDDDERNK